MLGCSVESEPLCYHWMVPETWWGSISWLFHLEPPSSGLKTKRSLTPLPENPELTHPSPVPWLLTQSDCSSLQIASGWATQSHSHSHKSRQTKQTYTDMSTVTHQHSGISYKNKHELLFFFFTENSYLTPKSSFGLWSKLLPLASTYHPWLPLRCSFLHFPSDIHHWRKTPPPCWLHVLFGKKY